MTAAAVVPQDGSMQLIDLPGTGCLMQAVDILRYDADILIVLKLRDEFVGIVGLCVGVKHLFPIEFKEVLGPVFVEGM